MIALRLLCCVALTVAADLWEDFKVTHDKSYNSVEEDIYRKNIFEQNWKYVQEHNERFREGIVMFDLEMNKFGDMTSEEFVAQMTRPIGKSRPSQRIFKHNPDIKRSENVDWRSKGAVTPVKDQGAMGCVVCYAAVSTLESIWFIKTGDLFDMSEQQLNDCVPSPWSAQESYNYIQEAGGIDSEESYGNKSNECMFNPDGIVAQVTGYVDIPEGDEVAQALAVHDVGPVSILIDAGHLSFQLYSSGIYYEPACGDHPSLNHALSSVGYGTQSDTDYWILKNSWGSAWGENGYMKVIRNKDNNCGVASRSCYPTV